MKTYARVIATASVALILLPISSGAKPPTDKPTPEQTTLSDLDCSTNQIAKFNGAEWVCADDKSASSFSKVIVDSNGMVIGPVLSDTPREALVEVEMGGQKWHVTLKRDSTLQADGWWPWLFYMTSDCSGDAYWVADYFDGNGSLDIFGGVPLPPRDATGQYKLPAEGASPLRVKILSYAERPDWCGELLGGPEVDVYLEADLVVQEDPFAGIEPPLRIVPAN